MGSISIMETSFLVDKNVLNAILKMSNSSARPAPVVIPTTQTILFNALSVELAKTVKLASKQI